MNQIDELTKFVLNRLDELDPAKIPFETKRSSPVNSEPRRGILEGDRTDLG